MHLVNSRSVYGVRTAVLSNTRLLVCLCGGRAARRSSSSAQHTSSSQLHISRVIRPAHTRVTMSWQSYVDDQLISTKVIKNAVIAGHDGNIWAHSAGFPVSEAWTGARCSILQQRQKTWGCCSAAQAAVCEPRWQLWAQPGPSRTEETGQYLVD